MQQRWTIASLNHCFIFTCSGCCFFNSVGTCFIDQYIQALLLITVLFTLWRHTSWEMLFSIAWKLSAWETKMFHRTRWPTPHWLWRGCREGGGRRPAWLKARCSGNGSILSFPQEGSRQRETNLASTQYLTQKFAISCSSYRFSLQFFRILKTEER